MTTLASSLEKAMTWRQPDAWKRLYELRSDRGVAGLLRFSSWLRSDATGQIGDREWRFVRTGFLTHRVEVFEKGSDTRVAEFTERFPGGSGTVALADGRRFEASNNVTLTEWRLCDSSDVPLVRCHHAGGFLHTSATVEIRRNSRSMETDAWLVLFGWYLFVLKHGNSA